MLELVVDGDDHDVTIAVDAALDCGVLQDAINNHVDFEEGQVNVVSLTVVHASDLADATPEMEPTS